MSHVSKTHGSAWGFDTREDRADDWRGRAECRNHDAELFFYDGAQSANVAVAKRICRSCPVLDQCRAWVAANPQGFGVWAGMTSNERRALTTPEPAPRPRWCQRCGNSFELDPSKPNARLCPACVVARERFADVRQLERERFGSQRRAA